MNSGAMRLCNSVIHFTRLDWAWDDRCTWWRKSWLVENHRDGGGRVGEESATTVFLAEVWARSVNVMIIGWKFEII